MFNFFILQGLTINIYFLSSVSSKFASIGMKEVHSWFPLFAFPPNLWCPSYMNFMQLEKISGVYVERFADHFLGVMLSWKHYFKADTLWLKDQIAIEVKAPILILLPTPKILILKHFSFLFSVGLFSVHQNLMMLVNFPNQAHTPIIHMWRAVHIIFS